MRTEISTRGDQSSPLYYDMSATLDKGYSYYFIIGGRGIGKTFSFFKTALDRGKKFMYLRYSGAEYDRAINLDTSPILEHLDPFVADGTKGACAIYDAEYDGDKIKPLEKIGYCGALTTFKNARGTSFGFSDGDLCLFDEFIPEANAKRLIKDPFFAWSHFYETAFRRKKIQHVFCSNADSLNSPILAGLDLIRPIEYMIDHDLTTWADEERSIYIELPKDVPISAEKANDPLYRLIRGTSFDAVALKNKWALDDRHDIKPQNLIEYKPLALLEVDDLLISLWLHKHDKSRIYYARTRADVETWTAPQFRAFFQMHHRKALLLDKVRYYDYHLKLKIKEVMQ